MMTVATRPHKATSKGSGFLNMSGVVVWCSLWSRLWLFLRIPVKLAQGCRSRRWQELTGRTSQNGFEARFMPISKLENFKLGHYQLPVRHHSVLESQRFRFCADARPDSSSSVPRYVPLEQAGCPPQFADSQQDQFHGRLPKPTGGISRIRCSGLVLCGTQ